MKQTTRQWINVIAGLATILAVVIALYLSLTKQAEPDIKPDIKPDIAQTHVDQLREEHSPPELNCRQLPPEELRFPGKGLAEVLCEANRSGFFLWHEQMENGDWRPMLRGSNPYPAPGMGFLFTTLPRDGLVRIVFGDMYGNMTEATVKIEANLRECIQANGCSRVVF